MPGSTLRAVRIAAWAAVLIAVAVLGWTLIVNRGGTDTASLGKPAIGGPFTLTDQTGATVTEAALQGHTSAVFFGYTYCPDVCPTTLAEITGWLEELGPNADKIKVYFITVDPERDTEMVLASYLEAFDPRIVGLTGPRSEIDSVIGEYRVYARKVDAGDGAYTYDHTASVYLFDDKGEFFGTVDYQDQPEVALAKLRRLIDTS